MKNPPLPWFPGMAESIWIGFRLDFKGIQDKPEATGTCLQREVSGSARQSREMEVLPLTFL